MVNNDLRTHTAISTLFCKFLTVGPGPDTNLISAIHPTFFIIRFRTLISVTLLLLRLTFIASQFFRHHIFPYRISAKRLTYTIIISIRLSHSLNKPLCFLIRIFLAFHGYHRTTIYHVRCDFYFHALMTRSAYWDKHLAIISYLFTVKIKTSTHTCYPFHNNSRS